MGPSSVISFHHLPKIELHVHLDTSLSFLNAVRLHPGLTESAYRSEYVAPDVCRDLTDFLGYPASSIALLQQREHLTMAIRQLIRELKEDGVIYAEIRFAPLLHLAGGLRAEEVVEAACEAILEGEEETGVMARLLLCTLRHFTVEQSMQTADLVRQFSDQGVVGMDLAGDEAFSLNPHIPAFRAMAEAGIPCTAHAGEARGADSVEDALEFLGVRRIGHGVRSIEDSGLVATLARHRIHLEVCPSSNLQTRVFSRLSEHSIDRLYRAGVSLSINTDGRGLTSTTLSREYALVAQAFGWEQRDFLTVNRMALQAAFLPADQKEVLRTRLEGGYGQSDLPTR